MMGDVDKGVKGLYALSAERIFSMIKEDHSHLKVGVSFFEIYCEKAFDLLNYR